MSKSPVNLNEDMINRYNALLNDKKGFEENCSEAINSALECVFKYIKYNLFEKIMTAINSDNRLTKYDEKIYNYYCDLIKYYSNTVVIYEENKYKLVSEVAKEILDGIYSVLISQINQFNEATGITNHSKKGHKIKNPIYEEKKSIIASNVMNLSQKIDSVQIDIIKNCMESIKYEVIENFYKKDISLVVNKKVIEYCYKNLFEIYTFSIKDTISKLNDMQYRDITGFYYEMFKEEKENLHSVIKIQVAALESEVQTKDEEEIIQKILFNLRECYQYISRQVEYFAEKFNVTENNIFDVGMEKDINNFKIMLIEGFVDDDNIFDKVSKNIERFYNKFSSFFIKYMDCWLNSFLISKKEICNQVNDILELSSELIKVFSIVDKYTENNKEQLYNCEYKDIIKGVQETIQIKIESLQEGSKFFKESCFKIVGDSEKNKISLEKTDKSDAVKKAYIYFLKEDVKIENLEEVFDENEFADFKLKELKKLENINESVNKKILQFEREQLFFEISTFEEILNYSVSRLRDCKDDYIVKYVSEIDNVTICINENLKKHNIDVISPKSHDMFNGKEHEVLMAEKNKDFNKGEIIKVMNSGYKQGNKVILRANVIAAK